MYLARAKELEREDRRARLLPVPRYRVAPAQPPYVDEIAGLR